MRDELLALSFPARRPLSLFALIFFLFALALPVTAATTKAVSTLTTNITSPPAKVIQSSANQVALIELDRFRAATHILCEDDRWQRWLG